MHRIPRTRTMGALAALSAAVALTATTLTANAETPEDEVEAQQMPTSFNWESGGPVIEPKPDEAHDIVSVKDPTVVRHDDQWLVYMTTANTSGGWSLAFTGFSDWSEAGSAPQTFLDTNPNIGDRYAAAPQLFYFAPKDEWYLVYQTGPPSYSVSKDPTDPQSWSEPQTFMETSGLLDYWTICDDAMCYLFSADDNGSVYRAETTVEEFPNGFRDNQVVMQDEAARLFEGGAVYKVEGSDQYLLMWEAIGSDNRRYYRSFTSSSLTGEWQPLAAEESNPFARSTNVNFPDGAWTQDISHGELIRSGNDQTMTIDPDNLQLLYQGHDPAAEGDYSQLPYRLGLATFTGATDADSIRSD